jgi:hypothetical protein
VHLLRTSAHVLEQQSASSEQAAPSAPHEAVGFNGVDEGFDEGSELGSSDGFDEGFDEGSKLGCSEGLHSGLHSGQSLAAPTDWYLAPSWDCRSFQTLLLLPDNLHRHLIWKHSCLPWWQHLVSCLVSCFPWHERPQSRPGLQCFCTQTH